MVIRKKAIIALSGGVDSAVSAILLKKQGFAIKGVFLKLFDNSSFKESEKKAREIANILDIPFFVLDLRKEFREKVIKKFLEEYKKGKTPNPCVICNKEIKFGLLKKRMKADYLATGHYSRLCKSCILKAKDRSKDQSYFLWSLSQKQLSNVIFPVGNYLKKDVKKIAEKYGIFEIVKKESQEICFTNNINHFLVEEIGLKPGRIIDKTGKIIARHEGLHFYTIGQRKGIKLSSGPYYVLGKDFKKNLLIVGKNKKDLLQKEANIENVNWISFKKPKFPFKAMVKVRYGQKSFPATVYYLQKKCKLVFKNSQRAITPGQSAVLYKGNKLLGGGIISLT